MNWLIWRDNTGRQLQHDEVCQFFIILLIKFQHSEEQTIAARGVANES
jgi:hypothetical protein